MFKLPFTILNYHYHLSKFIYQNSYKVFKNFNEGVCSLALELKTDVENKIILKLPFSKGQTDGPAQAAKFRPVVISNTNPYRKFNLYTLATNKKSMR